MALTMQRPWLLRIGVGLLVAVLLWLGACYQVVQNPTLNQPTTADAVVVLGAPERPRVLMALDQISAGRSHQLVISGAIPVQVTAYKLCQNPPAGVTVTCFQPQPATTRGEAEFVGRLAAEHGWKTIIVVTSRYHISRARLILDRCVSGRVEMVSSQESISASDWLYQYVYQSAGYVKTLFHQSC